MKTYEKFIGELVKQIRMSTGLDESMVFFHKNPQNPTQSEDRIYIAVENSGGVNNNMKQMLGFHCDELYDDYKKGITINQLGEAIMESIARTLFSEKGQQIKSMLLAFQDYETAKNHLFIRPLNVNKVIDKDQYIVRVIGDIALVLYFLMNDVNDQEVSSVKVQKALVASWGISEESVFQDALLNTYFLSPPRSYKWYKLINNMAYTGENFMDILQPVCFEKDIKGYCISTLNKTNGAISIFLPGVAQRIAWLFGESYYCVFTSIHEVMVHAVSVSDPDILREILCETIEEATPEDEILSHKVYLYDINEGFICLG